VAEKVVDSVAVRAMVVTVAVMVVVGMAVAVKVAGEMAVV